MLYVEVFVVGNAVVMVHDVVHRPASSAPDHLCDFMRRFDTRSDAAAGAFAVACIVDPRRVTSDASDGRAVFYTDSASEVMVAMRRKDTYRATWGAGDSCRRDVDMWASVVRHTALYIGARFSDSGPKKKRGTSLSPPQPSPRDRKRVRVAPIEAEDDDDDTRSQSLSHHKVLVASSQASSGVRGSGATGDDLVSYGMFGDDDDDDPCVAIVPESPLVVQYVPLLFEEEEDDE